MQFRFDANQEFQIDAIAAIVDLFEGEHPASEVVSFAAFGVSQTSMLPPESRGQMQLAEVFPGTIPNAFSLTLDDLLANLRTVQQRNDIALDENLKAIRENIQTESGEMDVSFPNFSVEMETGTGKTYVYIRTALELSRRYGFRKFVVVVPSVAIREGVLKTLKVTEQHFRQLYGNLPYRYYVYDSENLTQVRQFALASGVELMVMTIDSFNKASNVIRQSTDRLQGETPIHLVQAVRPILILDEPQNMESELRIKALSALNPLLALRYSATHRNPYNLVYRLTPYDAYRQGLVKRIQVASVIQEDDVNLPFVRLEVIKTEKKTVTATLSLHKLMRTGTVKETVVTVRPGDSLAKLTGRDHYDGFDVDEIDVSAGIVRFANNMELRIGESQGADKESIFEAQIRYTVEEHFRRQAQLKNDGVKVLSLFFIDRVDNFAQEDGIIRRLFIKAFNDLKTKFPDWKKADPLDHQAAYFAQKRRKSGDVDWLESTGKSKEDEAAYDLIMKDKERLLSFEEPVAFVFSHSALREGWDNPNIFQICTLNQTASEIKKRQEIGRGVRLAVNQSGDRVRDERTNVLTVIANESYEQYVLKLQSEIEEEYGPEGVPPKPPDARKRGVARLRKQFVLKPEFKELWDRIKHKTRYAVTIDTEGVLNDVLPELEKAEIRPPRITITKAQIAVGEEETLEAVQMGRRTVADLSDRYALPNLVDLMAKLMEFTSPPVRLTRKTLLEVFNRLNSKKSALDNPHEFATVAVRILKDKLADHLVGGIQYEKVNDWYEMALLEAEIESWMEYLVPAKRSVYDHVVWDSEIEKAFVEQLDKMDQVKLYLKLPSWFVVPTPVGEYNPDWAIVVEDRDEHGQSTGKPHLYLVRETKGTTNMNDLRPEERQKILCGKKHFDGALHVDYKVVTKAQDLLA